MGFNYTPNTYFYDIESFNKYENLFTVAFLEPYLRNGKQRIILSYLSNGEPSHLLQQADFKFALNKKVNEIFKNLTKEQTNIEYEIIYEDISQLGYVPPNNTLIPVQYGLQTFIQRYGLPKDKLLSQGMQTQIENRRFQATFDDDYDGENNPNTTKVGYLFSYNGRNYDETMLALILGEIIESVKDIHPNDAYENQTQSLLAEDIVSKTKNYLQEKNIPFTSEEEQIVLNITKQAIVAHQFFLDINYYLDIVLSNVRFSQYLTADDKIALIKRIAKTKVQNLLSEQHIREQFNDLLFDKEYKSNMKSVLDLDFKTNRKRPFYDPNTAKQIYNQWRQTGRFIDVALLNEKLSKVSLKRLMGIIGFRIQVSNALKKNSHTENNDLYHELLNDLVYNISDVIGLKLVFEQRPYQTKFKVTQDVMRKYPYIVYENAEKKIHKFRRINPDTTSAQIITAVITKNNQELTDTPVVEFIYPSPHAINYLKSLPLYKDKEIQPTDILEDSLKWFLQHVCQYPDVEHLPYRQNKMYSFILKEYRDLYDIEAIEQLVQQHCTQQQYEAFLDFKQIYLYYDYIRGKNFNASEKYYPKLTDTYLHPDHLTQTLDAQNFYQTYVKNNSRLEQAFKPITSNQLKEDTSQYQTNIFYFDKQAQKTSCFVSFGMGGIHGCEINEEYYRNRNKINQYYDEITTLLRKRYKKAKDFYTDLQSPDSQMAAIFKTLNIQAEDFIQINDKGIKWKKHTAIPNELFKKSKKKNAKTNVSIEKYELVDMFKYVSVSKANHEDFTSYYPMLISVLAIFKPYVNYDPNNIESDDDAKDEYLEIYKERAKLKEMAHDPKYSDEQRAIFSSDQNAQKLLLNSGSGAADTAYDNPVRKNNAINAMRIIGQLFAWRIGQAQALAGARVPSTNTDGLYTMDIGEELNNKILNEISFDMYIGIEPEIIDTFVSKDSNNRMEIVDGKITSAKGGSLTSHAAPSLENSLDHPALIDRMLAVYLSEYPEAVNKPFNRAFARTIIPKLYESYRDKNDLVGFLKMFQWILASSEGTLRFIYEIETDGILTSAQAIDHFNRIFLIKNNQIIQHRYALATKQKIQDKKVQKLRELCSKQNRTNEENEEILLTLPTSNATAYHLFSESYDQGMQIYAKPAYTLKECALLTPEMVPTYTVISGKIKMLELEQNALKYNDNLLTLTDAELNEIFSQIDTEAYIDILEATFTKSWQNIVTPAVIKDGINYLELFNAQSESNIAKLVS